MSPKGIEASPIKVAVFIRIASGGCPSGAGEILTPGTPDTNRALSVGTKDMTKETIMDNEGGDIADRIMIYAFLIICLRLSTGTISDLIDVASFSSWLYICDAAPWLVSLDSIGARRSMTVMHVSASDPCCFLLERCKTRSARLANVVAIFFCFMRKLS